MSLLVSYTGHMDCHSPPIRTSKPIMRLRLTTYMEAGEASVQQESRLANTFQGNVNQSILPSDRHHEADIEPPDDDQGLRPAAHLPYQSHREPLTAHGLMSFLTLRRRTTVHLD